MISGAFAEFGRSSRVMPPFHFDNLAQVRLGRSVRINPDCWILTVRRPGDDGSVKLDIGSNSGIGMGATISAAKSVVLGDHVLLARNVYISDHGHAYADISRSVMDQGISSPAPVRIGRRSWLGQNVVVLPGVTIGEHCIIGANSVVNSSIPDFSLAVGAPARVVKKYNQHSCLWEKHVSDVIGAPVS